VFQRLQRSHWEAENGLLEGLHGVYRFFVGEHEILVIYDATFGLVLPFLAVNASIEDVGAVMRDHGLDTDGVTLPIGNVLVRAGDRLVLLDTGTGRSEMVRHLLGDYVGELVPTLETLGISTEAITDVVFSHTHLDHVGGTSVDGRLVFPNARHHVPELEWAYPRNGDVPEHVVPLVEFARQQLRPLDTNGEQLSLYSDGDELVPGIRAIAMLGHSAGHHGLMVESQGERLILPFDALGHHVLHLRHPEWLMAPDAAQPDLALETRRRFLNRAADEQIPVLAHHFPFPGLGRIARHGDAFRWVPTS
jgi:glyoxylase-like metal-dependent hydrolase (beta-lactamase superfamily II)